MLIRYTAKLYSWLPHLQNLWFDLQLDALKSNQGYTKMHGQPTIKICNVKQARQIYQYKKNKNLVHQVGD
jgi:hypothetical protein